MIGDADGGSAVGTVQGVCGGGDGVVGVGGDVVRIGRGVVGVPVLGCLAGLLRGLLAHGRGLGRLGTLSAQTRGDH